MTVEATSAGGAAVAFPTPGAIDLVDSDVDVGCVPGSGAVFALGATTVSCTATDFAGNAATTEFDVVVVDTTPPTLSLPPDITVDASSTENSAIVQFTASASDVVDGEMTPVCTPASGNAFTVGTTTVLCSATDSSSNLAIGMFTVTVRDVTAPVLSVPSSIVADADNTSGAPVSFVATATDAVDGTLIPVCTPTSGSVFPIGVTTVTCTATDAAGNGASATFTVTIQLIYEFNGFFQPIDMERVDYPLGDDGVATVVNVANSSRNVPFKFQVFSPDGSIVTDASLIWLTTDASGDPAFVPSDLCDDKPRIPLERAGGGAGSLKFSGGQFNVGVTTPSPTTTTCYEFRAAVRGVDGQPIGGITALVEVEP